MKLLTISLLSLFILSLYAVRPNPVGQCVLDITENNPFTSKDQAFYFCMNHNKGQ